jgi:hypothetical protein
MPQSNPTFIAMKKLFLALPLLLLGAAGPAAAHSSLTVSVGPSYGYGYPPPVVRPYIPYHHHWRPRPAYVVPAPVYAYPQPYGYYAPPRVVARRYVPYGWGY